MVGAIVKRLRAKVPEDTEELQRVLSLPRYRWWEDPDLDTLVDEMTEALRTSKGQQRLRPHQAMALTITYELDGLLANILVGGGKTLITFLMGLVMDAKCVVLLVPASLRDKTLWEFEELEEHWQRHPSLHVLTYSELGVETGEDLLEKYLPDLIIADEVHKLKDRGAACTTRVERYFADHNDWTTFCGLSGTVMKKSLMDFQHLARWAIGPHRMPLPASSAEARRWALALDEKLPFRETRPPVGALCQFTGQSRATLKQVRKAFGEHLRQTPGILVTKASEVDASIVSEIWRPQLSEEIELALRHLRELWVTPGGEMCRQHVDVWRHARELVCGFYYRWEPQPPEEWLKVRAEWHKHVRHVLQQRYRGIDSPLQVERAVETGRIRGKILLERWRAAQATYEHTTVPVWIDDSVLMQVIERVDGCPPTLVWVEQTACGERLSELWGVPFFGEGGRDKKKRRIESLKGKEHAILSIEANLEGRNLQAWSRNEIIMPPPNGSILEQVMGRSHREGQEADDVFFGFMVGAPQIAAGLLTAVAMAEATSATMGIPQKLLLAGIDRKTLSVLSGQRTAN